MTTDFSSLMVNFFDPSSSMEQDIESLESELSTIEDFVDRVRDQLLNNENELNHVRQLYSNIECENKEIKSEFEILKKKITRLIEEKDEQIQLIDKQRLTIKQLEIDLDLMRQRFISALTSEKEALVARMKTQEETDKIIGEFNQKNSRIDHMLKVLVDEEKKHKESFEKTIQDISNQLQCANEDLTTKDVYIKYLEEKIANLTTKKDDETTSLPDMKKSNEELNQFNSSKTITSFDETICDSSETNRALANQETNFFHEEKITLQLQYDKLKANYEEAIKKVSNLNQQIAIKNRQIDGKNQQVAELQRQLNSGNFSSAQSSSFHLNNLFQKKVNPHRLVKYVVDKATTVKKDQKKKENINLEPLQMLATTPIQLDKNKVVYRNLSS